MSINDSQDLRNIEDKHTSFRKLQNLHMSNLEKIIACQLNINSLRKNIDIWLVQDGRYFYDSKLVMIESKLDNSLSVTQLEISGYNTLYRFDRNSSGDGILLYLREDITSETLHVFKLPMEENFLELNLYKTKWLLCYIYSPQKIYMSDILQEFRETLDVFPLKYSRIVIIDDFNAET